MPSSTPPKKRVLVVGAGAAGMSCAEQLSRHPDKFDVTLVEAQDYCGGQAFSIDLDEKKFGAKWMNQGVQGCVGFPQYCSTGSYWIGQHWREWR
jgi:predicted NAD/FAD-binding protein